MKQGKIQNNNVAATLSKPFLVLGTKPLILMAKSRYEFLKSNALWILPSVRHFNSQSVFDIPPGITPFKGYFFSQGTSR